MACDFSLGSLRLTTRTAQLDSAGIRGILPLAARADLLPLPDGSSDRVLLLDVIEHLTPAAAQACLREVHRILSPGGRVIVHTVPNKLALAVAYPAARLVWPQLARQSRSEYERRVHVYEQTQWSLRGCLRRSGFDARVWVEEWTTLQARRAGQRHYPDWVRSRGYVVLRGPAGRCLAWLGRTALAPLVANDIFAVGWRAGEPAPHAGGKFAPLRGFRR